ncbi:aminopeptidase P family protein [Gracilimonas mengyeensis]|uniref:Xaa-Pro aminopeptidase n=1 Tax=Gracilimonas mengyeensis TaxID=1302730 RepID=A0A521CNG1_9BACT|nr:aminopeptidase P family protein [Gracilimonas mengyeensis]SMO60994.1 Xaa-Pro dipeptidase [Gracilimonas mengyeensis]
MYKKHREKLFSLFDEGQSGVVFMQGSEIFYRDETDYEYPFRQESNFWYLTGVNEPDCALILDLKTEEYHLFVPKRDAQYAVWHGYVKSKDTYQQQYEPDHLHYDNEILHVLNNISPEKVYCLSEVDAELVEDLDRSFEVDIESLQDALTYCRVLKTDDELKLMRKAAEVNNKAHRRAMEIIKPGMFEYEVKAAFTKVQYEHGLQQDAYNGIFASGKNGAILHYVENTSKIKDGDLFLLDAGHEYKGYASDYTRTYPANGKFTDIQAGVYDAVLNALNTCIEQVDPGVKMEDLHMNAARIMMEGLKELDLVKGSVDDMMENDIFALFFPHGLGHFLGLDTHDVGGYPKGVERIDRPGIKFLRVRRDLQPGMVITIEPGIYFIPALLIPAIEDDTQSKFLNADKLTKLFEFGGIRIEDNVVVTDDGCENLTDVPKSREDIEKLMAG